MYESLLLIHPDTPLASATFAAELRRQYQSQQPTITERASSLELRFPDCTFRIELDRSPHVLAESAEIAARFGAPTGKQERIAACSSRFELRGDDDPDMSYFNDFSYIIEAAQRLGEVYAFDTHSRTFL